MNQGRAEDRLERLAAFGMRFDLGPMRDLLDGLRIGTLKAPVVHVAGTNGKGSTALYFSALAASVNSRVGLFTSPHLESPRERLRIDGVAISERQLCDLLDRVLDVSGVNPPTYFEALTASALLWFKELEANLIVLEVGLGGRLDATNAVPGSLALFAALGLDHTALLGDSLGEIAREKAGVLRVGGTAVTGPQPDEALAALQDKADEQNVKLRSGPMDREYEGLVSTQLSDFQERNQSLALTAVPFLADLGLRVPGRDQARRALKLALWPGRLERIDLPRLNLEVILDGAHNLPAVEALIDALQGESFDLLFGALADKEVGTMFQRLVVCSESVWLTQPPHPRAAGLDDLGFWNPRELVAHPEYTEAFDLAMTPSEKPQGTREAKGPRRLLVTGSLFLVGAVRSLLTQRYGVPKAAAETTLYG